MIQKHKSEKPCNKWHNESGSKNRRPFSTSHTHTFGWVIEAHQQREHGGLAAAAGAHEAHHATGLRREGEVRKNLRRNVSITGN